MWKKTSLLVTRWLQCLNVPSRSIMLTSARWKSPFPKDFNECFFSRTGKGSHPSEVTQWSECGGRIYVVLMTNLQSWGGLHQIDAIWDVSCRSRDDIFFDTISDEEKQATAHNHLCELYNFPIHNCQVILCWDLSISEPKRFALRLSIFFNWASNRIVHMNHYNSYMFVIFQDFICGLTQVQV